MPVEISDCNVLLHYMPTLVCFLRVLWFLPTPENQNSLILFFGPYFMVSHVCTNLLGRLGFNFLSVRCGYHTTEPGEPSGLIGRMLQKLLITIIY